MGFKRISIIILVLAGGLLSASCMYPDDYTIMIRSKDTKLPDWQWTSKEVWLKSTASGQKFTLIFSPSVYHEGDSVKITFNKYKVSLSDLNEGTTFSKWTGIMQLVYRVNVVRWAPLINDKKSCINKVFEGENNHTGDSVMNCSIITTIPVNLMLSLSVYNKYLDVGRAYGHPVWKYGQGTLTAAISGIEIKKL